MYAQQPIMQSTPLGDVSTTLANPPMIETGIAASTPVTQVSHMPMVEVPQTPIAVSTPMIEVPQTPIAVSTPMVGVAPQVPQASYMSRPLVTPLESYLTRAGEVDPMTESLAYGIRGPGLIGSSGYPAYSGYGVGYGAGYGAGMGAGLERYADILHAAMKGAGTDEDAIINVIANTNSQERAAIRRIYNQRYGEDLLKRLDSDLSGDFQDVVIGCFLTPTEYDAYELRRATKGLGTKEGVLTEIIGSRTPQELQAIKQVYVQNFGEPLETAVQNDTSGDYQHLLLALLQCRRPMNSNVDLAGCQADAARLYQAGEGKWGTDEDTFIRIFASRSPAELQQINSIYRQQTGNGLLKAIDSEFSGDIKELLQTVIVSNVDPAGYFADRIHGCISGAGTNDSRLIRNIVSRNEVDLPYIRQTYDQRYGSLLNDIKGDTSGNYRKILMALVGRCY